MEESSSKLLTELEERQNRQIIPLLATTFEQILQMGISLDLLYILEGFSEGIDVTTNINQAKAASWKQTLLRKGYIDGNNKITVLGEELLKDIEGGKVSVVKKRREKQVLVTTDFELWWKTYPISDTSTYKGRTFKGSRALRTNRDQCILKFSKIMQEGEYKVEEMIDALVLEKTQKMEETLRTGQNKMTYMQNSATYLSQRTFEVFIEILKDPNALKITNIEQVTKRVDI
jgi:hypothetical protein